MPFGNFRIICILNFIYENLLKSLGFHMHWGVLWRMLSLFFWVPFLGQQTTTWETKMYTVTDALVAQPNTVTIDQTTSTEKLFYQSTQPKSPNDYLALVIMLCNRAYFQNQLGTPMEAIATYEKAWRVFASKKLSRYDIVEYCYKPLGNLYLQTGQYNLAENCIKQYYYLSTVHRNATQKISAKINLSIVYQNTGQQLRAIRMLEEALHNEPVTTEQQCKIWNNLATNYMLLKDFTQAKYYLNKILNAEVDAVLHWNALRNSIQLCLEDKDYLLAQQYIAKAEKLSGKLVNISKRDLARFQYEKATVWYQLQKLDQASKALEEVYKLLLPQQNKIPNVNSLYLDTLFLEVMDLQKYILQAQHKTLEALKVADQAFLFEERLQRSLAFEQNQLIHQMQSHKRVEWTLGVYLDLYRLKKDQNWLEQAFLLVENNKSNLLLRNQQKYNRISKKEKDVYLELINLGLLIEREQQKYAKADINKINQWIAQQSACVLALKNMEQNAEVVKAWNWKDLSQFLQTNKQSLVSYFVGEEETYQFILEHGTLRCIRLGSSKVLKAKIRSYLNYFTAPDIIANNVKSFNHESHQLFLALRLNGLSTKRNIIIPDGLLRFLPFETLVTKPSFHVNFSKIPFLMMDKEISYSLSAKVLKTDFEQSFKPKVLGIFPVFKNTNEELIFSEMEKDYLQKHFEGNFKVGSHANFKTFEKEVKNYNLLHLSTHASSGDLETSASIKFIDREVYYSELYGLNLNPDLVVLSACETGLGKLYSGDSPLNVARGFQVAGASNLVFTLWKVNDFTTSKFMEHFYKSLQQKRSYTQALYLAKQAYLADVSIPNAKKSPYYWGAFVYYGQVEKEGWGSLFFWIGFFMFLLVFLNDVLSKILK